MVDYASRHASRSEVRTDSYMEYVLHECNCSRCLGEKFSVLSLLNHGVSHCDLLYCNIIPRDNYFGRVDMRQRRRNSLTATRGFLLLIGSFSGRAFSTIRFCGRAAYASCVDRVVDSDGAYV